MNQSLNKRKNNNIKFDKSPENFQINMNNIKNLGNYNWQRTKRRAKTRRSQKCLTRKSWRKIELKTEEEKPVEQPKEEPKEETKKEQKEEAKDEPKEEQINKIYTIIKMDNI